MKLKEWADYDHEFGANNKYILESCHLRFKPIICLGIPDCTLALLKWHV